MATLALSRRITAQVTAFAGQTDFAALFPALPIDGPPFAGLFVQLVRAGVAQTLALGAGFSVASPSAGGFTARLNVPAQAGDLVTVYGLMPAERDQANTPGGAVLSEVLEEDAMNEMALIQELRRDLGGAVRAPIGEALAPLVAAAARAGKLLGFDGAGQPILVPVTATAPLGYGGLVSLNSLGACQGGDDTALWGLADGLIAASSGALTGITWSGVSLVQPLTLAAAKVLWAPKGSAVVSPFGTVTGVLIAMAADAPTVDGITFSAPLDDFSLGQMDRAARPTLLSFPGRAGGQGSISVLRTHTVGGFQGIQLHGASGVVFEDVLNEYHRFNGVIMQGDDYYENVRTHNWRMYGCGYYGMQLGGGDTGLVPTWASHDIDIEMDVEGCGWIDGVGSDLKPGMAFVGAAFRDVALRLTGRNCWNGLGELKNRVGLGPSANSIPFASGLVVPDGWRGVSLDFEYSANNDVGATCFFTAYEFLFSPEVAPPTSIVSDYRVNGRLRYDPSPAWQPGRAYRRAQFVNCNGQHWMAANSGLAASGVAGISSQADELVIIDQGNGAYADGDQVQAVGGVGGGALVLALAVFTSDTITGTVTQGRSIVTNLSADPIAAGWQAGMPLAGAGIPAGATILALGPTYVRFSSPAPSAPATASAAGVALTVGPWVTGAAQVGPCAYTAPPANPAAFTTLTGAGAGLIANLAWSGPGGPSLATVLSFGVKAADLVHPPALIHLAGDVTAASAVIASPYQVVTYANGTLAGNTLTLAGINAEGAPAVGQRIYGLGVTPATITAGAGNVWTFDGGAQNLGPVIVTFVQPVNPVALGVQVGDTITPYQQFGSGIAPFGVTVAAVDAASITLSAPASLTSTLVQFNDKPAATAGGINYQVGDVLTLPGAGGTALGGTFTGPQAAFVVDSVDGAGRVLSAHAANGGACAYTQLPVAVGFSLGTPQPQWANTSIFAMVGGHGTGCFMRPAWGKYVVQDGGITWINTSPFLRSPQGLVGYSVGDGLDHTSSIVGDGLATLIKVAPNGGTVDNGVRRHRFVDCVGSNLTANGFWLLGDGTGNFTAQEITLASCHMHVRNPAAACQAIAISGLSQTLELKIDGGVFDAGGTPSGVALSIRPIAQPGQSSIAVEIAGDPRFIGYANALLAWPGNNSDITVEAWSGVFQQAAAAGAALKADAGAPGALVTVNTHAVRLAQPPADGSAAVVAANGAAINVRGRAVPGPAPGAATWTAWDG